MKNVKKFFTTLVLCIFCAVIATAAVFSLSENETAMAQNSSEPSLVSSGESPFLRDGLFMSDYMNFESDTYRVLRSYPRDLPTEQNGRVMSINIDEEYAYMITDNKYPNFYTDMDNKAQWTDGEVIALDAENKAVMNANAASYAAGTLATDLKKHPWSLGQFDGTLSDDAPAVEIEYYINPTERGQRSLGVFAPAGEIVTIEVPATLAASNAHFQIGLHDTDNNRTVDASNIKRWFMPKRLGILTQRFSFDTTTVQIGTPYGGMVYLNLGNFNSTATIKVSGGVLTPKYTYGITTEAEWEELRYAPGLYAELRAGTMRFLCTAEWIRNVENMPKIMDFYFKAGVVSSTATDRAATRDVVTTGFDYYVGAGEAVAYVGANFTQAPTYWAPNTFNYDNIMSGTVWGTLHEFNHHFQSISGSGRWGVGGASEIGNNLLNVMTYRMYSNHAARRTETGGLSDWNWTTSDYSVMNSAINESGAGLATYVMLMQCFGYDKMMEFMQSYRDLASELPDGVAANSESAFVYFASKVFQKDFTYFCETTKGWTVDEGVKTAVAGFNFTRFMPVANLYGMGYNGAVTGRPFYIPAGRQYTLDFRSYTRTSEAGYTIEVIPTFETRGTFEHIENDTYRYTPNTDISGDPFLLKYTFADGQEVFLHCELAQRPNYGAQTTRYIGVSGDNIEAALACEAYINATNVVEGYNVNGFNRQDYQDSGTRSIMEVKGKFVAPETGWYTFFLAADDKAWLMLKRDGEYAKVAEVNSYSANYNKANASTYTTVYLAQGSETYINLVNLNTGGQGFVRMGYAYHGATQVEVSLLSAVNIPQKYVFVQNADITVPEIGEYQSEEIFYSRPIQQTSSMVLTGVLTATSAPQGHPGENDLAKITDGNNSTIYHSKWSGGTIAFPHVYEFSVAEGTTFDYLRYISRRASDRIGDYEIWVGQDAEHISLWATGRFEADNSVVSGQAVNVRYIKLVALNNVSGNGWTVVSEVSAGINLGNVNRYTNATAPQIEYDGEFELDRAGLFGGGKAVAGTGTISFTFSGNRIGIYVKKSAEYGLADISIDGGYSQRVDLYSATPLYKQLVFVAKDLSDARRHTIVIKSVNGSRINFDFATGFGSILAPSAAEITHNSITINEVEGADVYGIRENEGEIVWQTGTTFVELSKGKGYKFYAKRYASAAYDEEMSNSTLISTLSTQAFSADVTISGDEYEKGGIFTVAITNATEGSVVTWQWYRNLFSSNRQVKSTPIEGATGSTYTVTAQDANCKLMVVVSGGEGYQGTARGVSSGTVVAQELYGTLSLTGEFINGGTLSAVLTNAPDDTVFSYTWYRNNVLIEEQTATTYVLTESDATAVIRVQVTALYYTGVLSADKMSLNSDITITASEGGFVFGQMLTATVAGVADESTLSYQWYRDASLISGAVAKTYTLKRADIGAKMRVVVSGAGFTGTVGSEQTVNIGRSAFSGTVSWNTQNAYVYGNRIQATVSGQPAGASLSYKWYSDGVLIDSASGAAYTLGLSDIGKTISVVAYSLDYEGETLAVTSPVQVSTRAFSGRVGILGRQEFGGVLTVQVSGFASSTPISYQWYRNGTPIDGGNTTRHILIGEDIGKTIKVRVSAPGYDVQDSLLTAVSDVIEKTNVFGEVELQSTLMVGDEVYASLIGAPLNTPYEYSWYVGGEFRTSGTRNYVLTALDLGKTVAVVVSTANYNGSISQQTGVVKDALRGSIGIVGRGVTGETLTAITNGVPGEQSAYIYQWYRNGQPITGATGSNYVLQNADLDASITVKLRMDNYIGELGSDATDKITTLYINIKGEAALGNTLVAYVWGVEDETAFAFQWYRDGVAIEGATSDSYTVTKEDMGSEITVRVNSGAAQKQSYVVPVSARFAGNRIFPYSEYGDYFLYAGIGFTVLAAIVIFIVVKVKIKKKKAV